LARIKKISLESRIAYIVDLQKEIATQQFAIDLIHSYVPVTLEQRIVHEYAIAGSVAEVAKKLNEEGLRVGNRKYIHNDVSDILKLKPMDELHEITKKAFQHNSDGLRY
jgi:L-lysine 2,3-aminomutase